MVEERVVLTPQEVAERMGVTLPLVYRALRAGKIPHVKLGDRYLVSVKAFEEWLSGQSCTAGK